jgi:hypothetical protein
VVRGIGDVHVAVVIERDAGRILQVGRGGRTAIAPERGNAVAGDRRDRPVRGDPTDPVIQPVGDEDIAVTIDATPIGSFSCASMAGPPSSGSGRPCDTWPATPEPAMVVIVPYAMRRTRLLASTTRMPPAASVATPVGPLSCASVAGPPSPKYPATPRPATRLIVASTNADVAALGPRRPAAAAFICSMDIL